MLKQISLGLAFAALVGFGAFAGCGNSDNNNLGGPDLAQDNPGNNDLAMPNSSPDMSFVCVQNPVSNDDFLNSCAPASVDKVDIMPFYPALAPNGVLPPLQ